MFVRTYRARTQQEAAQLAAADQEVIGHRRVSESWTPPADVAQRSWLLLMRSAACSQASETLDENRGDF